MFNTRLGANSRSSKRGRKAQRPVRRNVPMGLRLEGDIIIKRMTIPSQSISSTAGNIIAVTTLSDTLVQSSPASEWASFAARYQQYRVRAMHVVLVPLFVVNATTTAQNSMYYADFIGTATPGSAAQVLSDERAVIKGSCEKHTVTVTWALNPNAKLWNPTSAVIPAANSYGVALCSSTVATLTVSTVQFTYSIIFEVEFRGSQ